MSFSWTAGTGVIQYYLYVGSISAGWDIYGLTQGMSRSVTVSNVPTDGRTIYVRLWSQMADSSWQFNDYTYKAASTTFHAGEYVAVSGTGGAGLNLRSCASTACSVVVNMPDGTVMRIIGGPTIANGYTWWNLSGSVAGVSRTGWTKHRAR